LNILGSKILIKLLNRIPHTPIVKFGYSKIGSKLVKIVKEKQSQKFYEVAYGIKMFLDITNPYTWDLIEGKENEDKIKEIFVKNINKGDTVIDVGANIGEFSLIASKKIGHKGNVIAIEPLEQALHWLTKNFELNGFTNYEILELAVGAKAGSMTMYKKSKVSEIGILDPTITDKDLVSAGKILIDTIDNIILSRNISKVDMLKVDVEGFEYEVFLGCKKSFKQNKIKKIICEIHSTYLKNKGVDEKTIYSLLEENKFLIKNILHIGLYVSSPGADAAIPNKTYG